VGAKPSDEHRRAFLLNGLFACPPQEGAGREPFRGLEKIIDKLN